MSRLAAESLRRLEAIGVQVWQRRDAQAGPRGESEASAGASERREPPRIRLEAGHGRWLLVVDPADREPHARLLADIQAVPGAAACRFASWSRGGDSGVAADEVDQHGIEHLVTFGPVAMAATTGMIAAPPLDALATSAEAKRALWRSLRERLGD